MNARTKFWLKVALTVTSPVWCVPYSLGFAVFFLGSFVWLGCSLMVEEYTEQRE